MPHKSPRFPGFTPISDRIFIREGEGLTDDAKAPSDHPRAIVLFSWGDASPKHAAKFADAYRNLFPHARQIAILSPIMKGLLESRNTQKASMKPVIDAAYPSPISDTSSEAAVLVHVMSNSGSISYGATLDAYHEIYQRPMPHRLTVWDSAPGTPLITWDSLKRGSNAVALGVAPMLPLPFVVTQMIAGFVIVLMAGIQLMMGREGSLVWAARLFVDQNHVGTSTRKLFIYGTADETITPHEVEQHIATLPGKGYQYDVVKLEGSGHVLHMRNHPDRYWGAVLASWKKAQ